MKRPKSILLDYDLFVDLYVYTCRHSEPEDLQYMRIETGVRKKLEAMSPMTCIPCISPATV